MKPKFTFWWVVAALILALGAYSLYIRLFHGLGSATNLTDTFPWGLWIGFDVMCGVGLAAGGFTLSAIVHIFHLKRFEPVVRPAILTAFLGYLLVAVAITIDIGRPWRIWHPLVFWNPSSVMFEVAWCVTLYTSVLTLEFLPMVFERLRSERTLRILRAIQVPVMILGVLLSTLHQSSLGTLYLIVPNKLHAFWFTPMLPVLFFVSAVGIGLAMVIVEATWSRRAFGHTLDMGIMTKLGQGFVVVMSVYGVMRLWDMLMSGAFAAPTSEHGEALLFGLEMALMVVLPVGMLLVPRVRHSRLGLFLGAFSGVLGFVLNRLNVAITGMAAASGVRYQPHWMEWALTAALITAGLILFALAVRYLPVFSHEEQDEQAPESETAGQMREARAA